MPFASSKKWISEWYAWFCPWPSALNGVHGWCHLGWEQLRWFPVVDNQVCGVLIRHLINLQGSCGVIVSGILFLLTEFLFEIYFSCIFSISISWSSFFRSLTSSFKAAIFRHGILNLQKWHQGTCFLKTDLIHSSFSKSRRVSASSNTFKMFVGNCWEGKDPEKIRQQKKSFWIARGLGNRIFLESLTHWVTEQEELVGPMYMALTIAVGNNRRDRYSHQLWQVHSLHFSGN